jgi:hypothetical protein
VEKQLCERPFGEATVAFEKKCWMDPHVIYTHISHYFPSLTDEWTLLVSFFFPHSRRGGAPTGTDESGVDNFHIRSDPNPNYASTKKSF